MHWTAPGRVLIAWDGALGPSFAYDAETLAETNARLYDWYEVWRSTSPDSDGVDLGSTTAEAWLDTWVRPSTVYWYTVYGHMDSGGDGVQVGPRIRVETRSARSRSADGDVVPPSGVDTLLVRRGGGGNVLKIKPSADAESGVLAYLVYTDNSPQPAYVVWVATWDTDSDATYDVWTDRAGSATDGYVVRAIDAELNISELTDVTTPEGAVASNICPNPRFHVNVTDGWDYFWDIGSDPTPTRITGGLVAPLPDDVDACCRLTWPWYGSGGILHTELDSGERLTIPPHWEAVGVSYMGWADEPSGTVYQPSILFYDADGNAIPATFVYANPGGHAHYRFHLVETVYAVPEGAVTLTVYPNAFLHSGSHLYVTKFMISDAVEGGRRPLSGYGTSAITNPCAATDVSGWSESVGTLTRVLTVDGMTFPDPATTAFCMSYGGEMDSDHALALPTGAVPGDHLYWEVDLTEGTETHGGSWYMTLTWHTDGEPMSFETLVETPVLADWHHYEGYVLVPSDVDGFDVYITVSDADEGSSFYATNVNVYLADSGLTVRPYADGDVAGWEWLGAAHNSTSELSA